MQPTSSGSPSNNLLLGARAQRTVTGDEVEAIEVNVGEIKVRGDVMVEHGQLDAQLAHRLLDRELQFQSFSIALRVRVSR